MWMHVSAFLLLSLPFGSDPSQDSALQRESEPIQFSTSSATLWAGRSAVLSFACDRESLAEGELEFEVEVDDTTLVELLEPAKVLAGKRLGSLRLRALNVGQTRLRIGQAELALHIRSVPGEARLMRPLPEIVAPVEGSFVWGRFHVACELTRPPERDQLELVLELPGGDRLQARSEKQAALGPTQRALFEVDAEQLGLGRQKIKCLVLEAGVELASSTSILNVVRAGDDLIEGECESALAGSRPEAFGQRQPRIGGGAGASGNAYVVQASPYPQWVAPITIERAGRYQLMLTAKGDLAGGAFPSVGVSVDLPNPIRGATRLVCSDWQRLPVGAPIELEAGERFISLRFLNELNVGVRNDRNLYLDRYELLRIEESEATPVEASMMMVASSSTDSLPVPGFGLWVTFDRVFDGLVMNGRMRIAGHANWGGEEDTVAPFISLLVDGEVHATQQAARPVFQLDRAHLGEGEHDLQLVARLPDGRRAETSVQRLRVAGPVAAVEPRDALRFSVLAERWGSSFEGVLEQRGEEPHHRVATPKKKLVATLQLPDELEGSYRLLLDARGPAGDLKAKASAQLIQTGEGGKPIEANIQNWWYDRPMGVLEFAKGHKELLLTLEPREEDPVLRVRSLAFEEVRTATDLLPPQATILYPPPGHTASGVDALVVEAHDEDALEMADVMIDGEAQGTYCRMPAGAGHLVLPLLLRGLEPGEHSLAVRVIDKAGNLGQSETRTFVVSAEPTQTAGPYKRALHLLNRLALGPDPRELGELLLRGPKAWLNHALNEIGTGDQVAREFARTRLGDGLGFAAERLVVSKLLRTDNPVRSRFVLWVDNHFSTWSGKTGLPSEWVEHSEFARLGFAPFGELLLASATSTTMLRYLDQQESYAGRLNENYARELLELHTVGVDGGYTQTEVTELARLLCGLTVSQEAPMDGSGAYLRTQLRFAPELSDGEACTLFERHFEATAPDGRFERFMEVLEMLAGHPRTAHFLADKIAQHYVSSPAPPALVEHLSEVYLESGGDFRSLLSALVDHPDFWAGADSPRLANPLHYGLRVGRVLGYPQIDGALSRFLKNSGMGLFDRATPDGYPDQDAAWADTNGLMQRWRWVQDIPWAVRTLVPARVKRYSGGDPHEWRQRVVDLAAIRLTGQPLGEESNAAALAFLEEKQGSVGERVDSLTLLVCRMPEANLK